MNRRELLSVGMAAGAALALGRDARATLAQDPGRRFKLKYAPHFGMFKAHAPGGVLDELKFMSDQGFTALEDNGMKGRPPAEQEAIAGEMRRLGMTMGVFVAHADFKQATFNSNKPETRERILQDVRDSVVVAQRVGAKWCTVVPGARDPRVEDGFQTAWCIDNLKRAAEICERAGLVMVLEPLNWWTDHPGVFLTKVPQAYAICKAVASPSCKILFDMYHQQIQEGNIIPNIDLAWDEVAYFQIGDNPGRKEPTTGELNYRNIFRHIHGKGFDGVLGMEHGNSRPGAPGEQAVIDAYVYCDDF
jgi:hydroxypyruvate isomerase